MISCISLKMYVLCESSISPIFTVYSRDDDSQLMLSNFIFTNGQCGLGRSNKYESCMYKYIFKSLKR